MTDSFDSSEIAWPSQRSVRSRRRMACDFEIVAEALMVASNSVTRYSGVYVCLAFGSPTAWRRSAGRPDVNALAHESTAVSTLGGRFARLYPGQVSSIWKFDDDSASGNSDGSPTTCGPADSSSATWTDTV